LNAAETCSRCESRLERGDLRCPVCRLASPFAEPQDMDTTSIEVLRCGGCGAAVSYTIDAAAPQCAFCGSVTELETPEDPLEQVEHTLPFTVDRVRAEAIFRDWLRGLGWFRPSDLRSRHRLESMRGLWWVGWVVDATALVSWTADSDAGTGRADWAPHSGRVTMTIDDMVSPASRGLTDSETERLLVSYDLSTAADEPVQSEDGAVVERFDVPRSHARRHVAAEIDRRVRSELVEGVIPGNRFRNVNAAVLARGVSTRRIGFPAWVIAYRYRRKLYRFVLSGQDPTCLMGDAPISAAKVVVAILGGIVGLLALLAVLI
jgi:hypothetical protein